MSTWGSMALYRFLLGQWDFFFFHHLQSVRRFCWEQKCTTVFNFVGEFDTASCICLSFSRWLSIPPSPSSAGTCVEMGWAALLRGVPCRSALGSFPSSLPAIAGAHRAALVGCLATSNIHQTPEKRETSPSRRSHLPIILSTC